ncbi:ArnT family glycosyltransferase [Arenimonas oryziterrae]|uniref:Glycosyltransferase RgtA/B/C/D-like domain-containing protein n=1 Tax=Arenimonas oryziterrae DSM 21050 = YC6267 TaxID=1121015 RepID=A0A091AQS7_9GAMM|nr:glycosyltransferase family 39 protein [Arenimonas oryziterrae]KFN42513.1 hypothetical protein N789_12805 [Arenimonas oryziterrae DSM 21050 = YC6267]
MSPIVLIRRHPLAALLALALLLGLAFQGSRGLLEPDEGRYTNVALQMLHTGDFISLRRNSEALHFTKPPLTYWTIAASVATFGHNEWAVRLPIALAFVLSVGLIYGLGKRFVPEKPWLPALIYATCPIPMLAANTVNTDSVLAAMETLAVLCYVQARFGGGSRWWIDAMWVGFGLAFLTKGPPGLLPLLAITAFHLSHRRADVPLLRPLGLLGFALVGLGWYGVVIRRHPGLLDYFLGHEVYARIATDKLRRFPQWYGPLIAYLPTLTLGVLPWLAAVIHRRWGGTFAGWKQLPESTRFLWFWFVIPLVIFCLARSRLPLYVLPLFAPLCLLMAGALREMTIPRWGRIGLGVWLALLVALKAGFAYAWVNDKDARQFTERLRPLLPGPPSEILFVEDMTRNGLNLYFRTEVERLSFKPMPHPISDSDYDATVADEMTEQETGRIFIMKTEVEQHFLNAARAGGREPVLLGHLPHPKGNNERDRVVYTLRGDFPGK